MAAFQTFNETTTLYSPAAYTTPYATNAAAPTHVASATIVIQATAGVSSDPLLDALVRELNKPCRHHPLPLAPRVRAAAAVPALPVRPAERILRVQHRAA
jgi:hypothetical protein